MEIISAEDVIKAQWDQFLGHRGVIPNAYESHLGLRFEVHIAIENHGYEKDGNTHHPEWERRFYRCLEIIVTARHEVFVRSLDTSPDVEPSQEPWINTSNHDSCWRSDGLRIIWQTLCEGHKACWGHMPEEHSSSMKNMDAHCHINGGPFSKGAVQFVRVKTEATERSGWRKLVEARRVGFRVDVAQS